MRRPVVSRGDRAVFLARLRAMREADCTVFGRAVRPRCGRCFACEMADGEAALLRLSRH